MLIGKRQARRTERLARVKGLAFQPQRSPHDKIYRDACEHQEDTPLRIEGVIYEFLDIVSYVCVLGWLRNF